MRWRVALTGMLAMLAPVAATAQQASAWTIAETGTVVRNGVKLSTDDGVRAKFRYFSQCVLALHGRQVEAVLAMPAGAESYAAMGKLVDGHCLPGGMLRMPADVMRGGLFVATYQRGYTRTMPALPASAPDLSVGLPEEGRGTALLLRSVADCLWRVDGGDAQAALTSTVGSDREQKAFVGLQAHLQGCSPDRPIRFSKATLSAVLAEVALIEVSATGAKS